MNTILATSLSFLLLYKYWAFLVIIFLGAFILPLPDNLIFLATGAFASQGYFNITIVLILALLTTVGSDMLGYFLTKIFGPEIFRIFHVKEKYVKKIEHYVNDYTGVTIFLTRIAGPFGPAVNFIAGLIEVPWQKFLLYDVLGNLVDIVIYVVAGYLLGNYWLEYSNQIGVVVAVLGSILIVAFILMKIWKGRSVVIQSRALPSKALTK